MENSLLKQILQEYDLKRIKAINEAEARKKELLSVNPLLEEIERKLSNLSINTTKKILRTDSKEKEQLLVNLKKETTKLIKEKNSFLKSISKDSRLS